MTIRTLRTYLPALLALPALAFYGGWATVTMDELPESITARQPATLTFTVRQHGRTPLSGLKPRVEAISGSQTASAAATAGRNAGQYVATLTVPTSGQWSITIHSGFGSSKLTLEPMTVTEPTRAAVEASDGAEAARGRRLFVAKGCVTCHLHRGVAGSGEVAVGPELTEVRLDGASLRQFLANPELRPPSNGRTERMPNLNLRQDEIAALVAFLR